MENISLHICVTCTQMGAERNDEKRDGMRLFEALSEKELPEHISLKPVRCLSACSKGCNVAFTSSDGWSYIYGKLDPDLHQEDIIEGIKSYAQSPDGKVPKSERPEALKTRAIARLPALF